MLPDIPNGMALLAAINEFNETNMLRADINRIEPGAGDFLDAYIDDLKRIIRQYPKENSE